MHVESGWTPADTDIDAFEQAFREVCEPIFAKPLSEISFGHVLLNLFNVAREFNMEVQPQLVLLQKLYSILRIRQTGLSAAGFMANRKTVFTKLAE
ncbi:ubiquinone biosynthesis protein [Actinobacillus equuli]|nr:ubiquinone biosynthesis protein [Actinobacillus equuli]